MSKASRRLLLSGLAAVPLAAGAATTGGSDPGLGRRVLARFDGLPGQQAVKILAPATATAPEFRLEMNSGEQMFIGSAMKAFVLCERMRQLDGPDIRAALTGHQLKLDESVWSSDSATFNPPHLSGTVTERTAMEAMILHSDNTATDMVLAATGPDRVRTFLARAGLRASAIPDSTRAFVGYLLGVPDFRRFTWADLVAAADKPIVNMPLNPVQTLASSADDLVAFYQRSLGGEFFRAKETLEQYRNVLRLGDVIDFVFPPGVGGYAKGGSIDVAGFHALCVPGAMMIGDRTVYVAMVINWSAPAETDLATVQRYLQAVRGALTDIAAGL